MHNKVVWQSVTKWKKADKTKYNEKKSYKVRKSWEVPQYHTQRKILEKRWL